ncbi:DUF1329 domain-containing protein [Alkalimarinus alittae]|uniref:DUF1329 domain-containing protein n=1 Tax=Alkalimarinus alittae TaxID=2961619 RepID=A0ABY6MYN0_9ALTE|nr:DUF1329 domain-containing protein [Alkalimarinus alittae]UZE94928.1 DUF1329 domain-containing protein [Alkalimarinus alittae]
MHNQRAFIIALALMLYSSFAYSTESSGKTPLAALGLTPLGAEAGGNATGVIPAWNKSDILTRQQLAAIANEQPLFYIAKDNLNNYKDNLSLGQQALIKAYPDSFKMPIYKTYRTHHVPEYVYQATQKNYLSARLIDDGNGITDVWQGVPFPVPQNALEALWNHLVAWRGVHMKANVSEVLVQANGHYQEILSKGEIASPYYAPDRGIFSEKHVKTYYLTRTVSPPSMAGGGLLIYDTLNQRLNPRKSWFYDAQQRRVKRIPVLAYDTPNPNSEMVRVVDEVDLFNGLPDRYDWELLGKQEVYIPYNNELLVDIGIEALSTKHHINLDRTRYELHRVWVLEAKLKERENHIYGRRRLYLDEDSWLTLITEQYDKSDKLWRVSLSYTKFFPQMPGIWKVADTYHDLKSGQHFTQSWKELENSPVEFFGELPSKRYFSPSSLRQSSHR